MDVAAEQLRHASKEALDNQLKSSVRELELVSSLRRIAFERSFPTSSGLFNNALAHVQYFDAFADAGIDIANLNVEQIGNEIRRFRSQDLIVDAIDDWAIVCLYDTEFAPGDKGTYTSRMHKLLKIASYADGDSFRASIRNPDNWTDRERVIELVNAPASQLTATLARMMAIVLRRRLDVDSESLLRRYQSKHRDDFWLNFDLAELLRQKMKQRTPMVSIRQHLSVIPNIGSC